jgi:CDP-diacylglycerol---serine O-phosphatidyltransferase
MSKLREAIPSLITFTGLSCGMLALMLTSEGNLWGAGTLILTAYALDALDGIAARHLGAASEFGIHLDSIVDVVSLGVAPAVLVTQHLRAQGLLGWLFVLPTLAFVIAGAFRLARFNLYAPLGKTNETLGLTISTAGAFVTLAVLSDLGQASGLLHAWLFLPLLLLVAVLMASRIHFPEFNSMIRHRRETAGTLAASLLLCLILQPAVIWFAGTCVYLCFGLARAIPRRRQLAPLRGGELQPKELREGREALE